MTVHLFPVTVKRGTRLWLVSAGGGRQLRGEADETREQLIAQWERTWGKITQVKKEKEADFAAVEARIEQMRKAFLERRDKG